VSRRAFSEQLNVGIGTLAGSTIMLLTMPWFLSILGGRVNLDSKTRLPNYKGSPKLDPGNSDLFNSGVTISKMVHMEAYIMLLTAMTYLVLQVPGMMYIDGSRAEQAAGEKIFAQIGACLCLLFFCGYLYLQYLHSGAPDSLQDKTRDEFLASAIAQKKVTLLGVMTTEYQAEVRERKDRRAGSPYHKLATVEEGTPIAAGARAGGDGFSERFMKRLRKILRPFFRAYDTDDSGNLQIDELRVLFEDMGESLSRQEVLDLFSKFDSDKNGSIDYDEFVQVSIPASKQQPCVVSIKYASGHFVTAMSGWALCDAGRVRLHHREADGARQLEPGPRVRRHGPEAPALARVLAQLPPLPVPPGKSRGASPCTACRPPSLSLTFFFAPAYCALGLADLRRGCGGRGGRRRG
jgi:hypothetical protein